MVVGSIVYATDQGLGVFAKDFYDKGMVDEVVVVPHSRYKNHYEWYPNRLADLEELVEKCDVLLFFETPFFWKVVSLAREKGVRTVLMPMYECTLSPLPYKFDAIWCPSELDMRFFKKYDPKLVQVPVGEKWTERKKAKVFVHNAGNGGLGGRNGTKELVEAMKYVKSPTKLIIRTQKHLEFKVDDDRIKLELGTKKKSELFAKGDVFIFPEKFNGLSLPLQEAYASGMLVMCGKRFPMIEWLPNKPMIPVKEEKVQKLAVRFMMAEYDPKQIAKTIDEWYGKDITEYSLKGKKWGKHNSWDNLIKKYHKLLCEV